MTLFARPTRQPRSARSVALVLLGAVLALACLSSLQGCTTLNAALNSGTTQSILIQDGVQLGTQALILHQPAASQATVAQQIITAATAAEGVLQDSPTAVMAMDSQLATLLAKTKLPAPTQTLLVQVASLAVEQLSVKMSAGALLTNSQAPVVKILSWIIQGATPYATPVVTAASGAPVS